jgi:hypothetical protein
VRPFRSPTGFSLGAGWGGSPVAELDLKTSASINSIALLNSQKTQTKHRENPPDILLRLAFFVLDIFRIRKIIQIKNIIYL